MAAGTVRSAGPRLGDVISVPWVAVAAAASICIRVRMVFTPVSTDEGGYLAIARAWSHGAVLYRDVWVDRPQGLLVLFRVWDWISGGDTGSIRLLAMLFGLVLVGATAVVAGIIAGRSASVIAAFVVAATSASPVIEGHTANAELLSGALTATGLAIAAWSIYRGGSRWLMVGAGVVTGLALSMKQSGFDGAAAIVVWLTVMVVLGRVSLRSAVLDVARLAVGVVVVTVPLVVHGAVTGWSRWWYAMAGYRLQQRSVTEGADWHRLHTTTDVAWWLFFPTVVLLLAGGLWMWWERRRGEAAVAHPGALLCMLWQGIAAVSFLVGGQFYRHYWVLLCAPAAAGAGIVLARVRLVAVQAAVTALLIVPGLVDSIHILRLDRGPASITASADPRLLANEQVASWFHRTAEPGDTIYAMCASAAFYADAHVDPPFPYLWWDAVRQIPGALPELRSWLTSAHAPTYLVEFISTRSCDPTGALADLVGSRYRAVTSIGGYAVLRRVAPG